MSSVSPLSWAGFAVVVYHSHGLQNEDSFSTCSVVFGLGSSVLEFCQNRTLGRSSVAISIHSHHSFVQTSLHNLELLILVQVTGCKRALESCVCGRSRYKGWTFSVVFLAIWERTTTVCRLKCWAIRFLNSVELCSQPSVHSRNRSPLPTVIAVVGAHLNITKMCTRYTKLSVQTVSPFSPAPVLISI